MRLKAHQGKQVHKILKFRLCKKCYKSRKIRLNTKSRGMKYNRLKEDETEGLRKVQDENGEDLYMRADMKALDNARRDRLRNAFSGNFLR